MALNNSTTKKRSFKHLSAIQRGMLAQMIKEGSYTQIEMAKELGVSQSTISREIKRGTVEQLNTLLETYIIYAPDYAEIKYQQNRERCRISPGIEKYDLEFWKEITKEIKKDPKKRIHSIDTFVKKYKEEHPEKKIPCTKTVYNLIDKNLTEIKNIDLPMKVRMRKRNPSKPKGYNKKVLGRSISERPESVLNRQEFGHYELDLVESIKRDSTAIMTLVERKTRHIIALKIENKEANTINKALKPIIQKLIKDKKIISITTDKGSEFSRLSELEKEGIDIYFTHAYSAWEKGTNERANRMIREAYPKGTVFKNIKDSEIQEIVDNINKKPRRILHYKSSQECFACQ